LGRGERGAVPRIRRCEIHYRRGYRGRRWLVLVFGLTGVRLDRRSLALLSEALEHLDSDFDTLPAFEADTYLDALRPAILDLPQSLLQPN
jgi:hypothetical protein